MNRQDMLVAAGCHYVQIPSLLELLLIILQVKEKGILFSYFIDTAQTRNRPQPSAPLCKFPNAEHMRYTPE